MENVVCEIAAILSRPQCVNAVQHLYPKRILGQRVDICLISTCKHSDNIANVEFWQQSIRRKALGNINPSSNKIISYTI